MPSTVPRPTNWAMRLIGALPEPAARRWNLYPRAPVVQAAAAVGSESLVRFATVPRWTVDTGRFAPIRTKFALPCAFAVITIVHSSERGRWLARPSRPSREPCLWHPQATAPEARRAVVSAGGIPERWVGGRLKAALATGALAALRRSPAVAGAEIAETSSADAIISQGVALSGAGRAAALGARRQRRDDRRPRPGLRRSQPAERPRGQRLPPIERQHRLSFDDTYGLAGRDYNGNSSRHGEFVSEIVYDMAPGATYWFLNYHSPDEFGRAVDYIANVIKPKIVVHSNSFLFGPFDGSGWFAQKVDEAAASGVLWVNSAGNYRTRHWRARGATPTATATSTCRRRQRVPGWSCRRPAAPPATSRGRARPPTGELLHARALPDAALTTPAIDKKTHQPIKSNELDLLPDPHASMLPGSISSPGPYYVAVRRVGNPPTTNLTLYCRMDLSPTAQVTASSSPTPATRPAPSPWARSTPRRCCRSPYRRRGRPTTAATSPTSPRPRTC